jgi:PPOX class probable F420-dependent enzyme
VTEPGDDIRAFLAERRYAVLATHEPDGGGIHLTPIWFLFEDGRFCFESFSGSKKVANLERNASASVVVDARRPGDERWVSASGPVEILSGPDAQAINARIRRRYLTDAALADERIEPVYGAADDVTIVLTPARWRSWTARGLDEQSFGGILGATPERWFLPLEA